MPSPAFPGLLQPDGAVIVPASLAAEVLQALARDVVARARDNGGQPTACARRLLGALYEAAQRHEARALSTPDPAVTSASGSVPAGCVTVQEAARLLECSGRWVRHLAGCGVLTATRAGRAWLIDIAALDAYRRGAG